MNRLMPVAAGLLLALAVPLLAGCGAEKAAEQAAERAAASASASYEAARKTAKAEHDRRFKDVALICSDGVPSASPEATASRSMDPEAQKYAENHAFKRKAPLSGDAACRGEAHAKRVARGLGGVRDEPALRAALGRLGYGSADLEVYETGGSLGFTFLVPDAGPCITGLLRTPPEVESHGFYMEGGCKEPKGGH
ncbi:hypothetical protein ACFQ6Q_11160 [Streptomyces sp. NPDC056437]|uniref:hypothetical protein n=1 Tax=Streptomyces sp. NPDC056437 TaxID=3345816 RepID=UPI0036C0F615